MLTAVTCSTLGLTDGAACCCVSACGRTAARVRPNPRGARACRFPGCTPRATSLYQYVGNFVRSYSPPRPPLPSHTRERVHVHRYSAT